MLSRFRHIFGVVFFLLVASCSGGGCSSGCGGCGGTTPLPGGYPKDKAIENAASVRVSRPGLDFVEKSLPALASKVASAPGGKLTFEIPTVPINQNNVIDLGFLGGIDLVGSVCPGGPDPKATPPRCTAEVNIGGSTFLIDSVTPNALTIRATIPIQLDDTPIAADLNPGPAVTLHVGYGSNGTCIGPSSERPSVNPKPLPVTITIPLVEETTAPRNGYTKIDIDNAVVNLDAISGDDIRICADCGPLSFSILGQQVNLCNPVLNLGFIKNLLVGQLKSGLQGQVKSLLADALCTAPVPTLNPPCPTGSKPNAANDKCVYNSDANKCVPMLLGTDAHVDLGGFLKSISPGTTGGLDFGLAANGAMKPFPNAAAGPGGRTPNGVTLGMIGGVTAQPPSKCVPQAALKVPTGIPIPDELAPTANDPATAPHVGIALSGRFLDYSMGSVYNSGLLCLGVSSEQFDMLRAGLLSLLVPSLKSLTFQQGDAAAAISTRPQAPPTVKLGGGTDVNKDPLIAITLPKFALDFYLWHQERYTRVFTFEADLTVPVNLQTGKDPVKNPKGGILPTIGDIKVANGKVTNADLLMDEPVLVAAALQGLLGGISKQLVGGGFSPIDLSGATSSLGLNLEISQIKKLTKGSDEFVGLFANLSKAAGTATVEADTKAVLVSKKVDPAKMGLSTMDRAAGPELVIDLSSSLDQGDAQRAIEYSWWIDNGTRSPWSAEKHVVIRDDGLFLQGKHVLRVTSRIAGQPETEDASPAEIAFAIDAVAPFARVQKDGASVKLEAWDIVSSQDKLVARYRLDDGAFGEWRPLADLARIEAGNASVLEAEVKDEEGNVRSVTQELIRGKADSSLAAAGSGCGCSTPGNKETAGGTLALLLGVLGLGAIALRRRGAGASVRHGAFAVVSIGAVAATSQGCGCGSEDDPLGTLCGKSCQEECKPALQQGRPGTYMSLAKAGDGSIWVAGYNEALIFEGDNQLFGDLVVGKYDLGKQQVEWTTVDGLPARSEADGCADRAKDSWRNGESDSGDDVGLYTSIQVSASGKPMVSYYDLTHKALKFAYNEDGTWKNFTVRQQPGADVGRYGKMVLDGGKPAIAFLQTETGNGGKLRSKIVVARAKSEIPKEPGDFSFEDAAVEENNPCTGDSCGAGACVKDTGTCAPKVGGCTPADCGTGKACVTQENKATCVNVQGTLETYANVFGARIAFAAAGSTLGLAVYDRPHGNLVALVSRGGGRWDRVIVDGETGSRNDKTAIDTGDVGIAPSIAIDGSTWHLSYVSGLDETLRYVTFSGDKPGKPEIVDDGSTADGKPFTDGKHLVGDDSFIRYQGDIVTIVYQDATAGQLRRAVGTKSGATRKWDIRTLQQPGKWAGFYPAIVPGEDKVANFWETAERSSKNFNGDVAIVSP